MLKRSGKDALPHLIIADNRMDDDYEEEEDEQETKRYSP
jgi:hypothetical protein